VREDFLRNSDDLGRDFALSVDDFREAFPQRAVAVHFREIEIVRVQ